MKLSGITLLGEEYLCCFAVICKGSASDHVLLLQLPFGREANDGVKVCEKRREETAALQ